LHPSARPGRREHPFDVRGTAADADATTRRTAGELAKRVPGMRCRTRIARRAGRRIVRRNGLTWGQLRTPAAGSIRAR